MAKQTFPVGGGDVEQDATTKALVVELETTDAAALAALAAAAGGAAPLAGPTKVTVTNASQTLHQIVSGLLNASTTRLRFIVPTSGIFWAYGTATAAASAPLLPGTNFEANTNALLATLQFIVAAGTVDMWVEEY